VKFLSLFKKQWISNLVYKNCGAGYFEVFPNANFFKDFLCRKKRGTVFGSIKFGTLKFVTFSIMCLGQKLCVEMLAASLTAQKMYKIL
jgi:hypothetical protein